ncbi:MAG: hypothetical protein AB2A00_20400 [Myxococcota bacterium]
MTRRRPVPGLLMLAAGLGALVLSSRAEAQLGVFGGGGDDGGGGFLSNINPESGPMFRNPWRADGGPETDSGGGLASIFSGFKGGTGGFLKTRAPHIADWIDSDGSVFASDGGGFRQSLREFQLPSFGAAIDAGTPDIGPVVAPQVRVARPREQVEVLTSMVAPNQMVWAHVPPSVQQAMTTDLAARDGGTPKVLSYDTLTRAERTALWAAAAKQKGWSEGHPAFLLGESGKPIAGKLVALGARAGGDGKTWFYAGFVTPRAYMQPLSPRVVLVGTANVGRYPVPQPRRAETVPPDVRAAVDAVVAALPVPQGRGRPKVGRVQVVLPRTGTATHALVRVTEARKKLPLCMTLSLDEKRRPRDTTAWSSDCQQGALAAVDVEGDGVDEVVWQEGERLVLRRYPGGEVLDEDPPSMAEFTQAPAR